MAGSSRRQFFQHGELALVILALLASQPMHGYELMSELDRRLQPAYRPSPGGVYPALAALVGEGLLVAQDGAAERRRKYTISRAGREALRRRKAALAAFEVRTGCRLDVGEDLDQILARVRARLLPLVPQVGDEEIERQLDSAVAAIEEQAGHDAARRAAGTRSGRG